MNENPNDINVNEIDTTNENISSVETVNTISENSIPENAINEPPVQEHIIPETPIQDNIVSETPVQDNVINETPVQNSVVSEAPIQENNIQDPYNKYMYQGYDSIGTTQGNGYIYNSYFPEQLQENTPSAKSGSDKNKEGRSTLSKFLVTAAMAAVFGLIASAVIIGSLWLYREQNPSVFTEETDKVYESAENDGSFVHMNPSGDFTLDRTSTVTGESFAGTDVSDVVEKVIPALVSIDCVSTGYSYYYGTYESSSAGSGIIIEKSDKELMIATNNHVIENAKKITVTFIDGTTAEASVKGKDEVVDLAVISVKLSDIPASSLDSITVAKLGNSDEIQIGKMAIAIGNSLGYGTSVTVGYISAKNRDITIDGVTYTDLLQTDAAINPGNSGGALININGEVIGINMAKRSGTGVEGMGYAIPISKAQDILADFASREILSEDEQGFLGVIIKSVTDDMIELYGWPAGAYVKSVVEGGAAEKAGIQARDIITKINDSVIRSDESLVERIQTIRVGTEITVTVQRLEDGEFKEIQFTAVLGERPEESN